MHLVFGIAQRRSARDGGRGMANMNENPYILFFEESNIESEIRPFLSRFLKDFPTVILVFQVIPKVFPGIRLDFLRRKSRPWSTFTCFLSKKSSVLYAGSHRSSNLKAKET